MKKGSPPKVALVSLGCPKNTVDSEVMLGHLARSGVSTTSHLDSADVVVVNTCGFIEAAREESIETILELTRLKEEGRNLKVVVAGCMVQRYREDLRREIPEIDAFVDLDGLPGIAAAVSGVKAAVATPPRQLPVLSPGPLA
ncbi:MAG: 30S ribosomal protein S12 methylthiotransferase RimO, partial [Acidobacteriota bacterium]